jgi:iron complex transport system substrate-binding protein
VTSPSLRDRPPRLLRSRPILGLLTATLSIATLAACGVDADSDAIADSDATAGPEHGDTTSSTEGSAAGDGPVTIEHAFGETTVPESPQRVVTWGWGSADAALALGVAPVAMPFQAYGGDDEGILPWVREYVEAESLQMPEVLPDSQAAPVEAIAATRPDLILAPYSGITDTEYEQLSQIAPTVAYPEEPWATPWRETIEIVGTALRRETEARAVLDGIDEQIAAEAAAHPEFQGRTIALVWDTADAFYVYRPADARVDFTLDLGFESAPSVEALAAESGEAESFYYTLSPERLDELDSDVLVSYADTPETSAAFLASDRARLLDQVERGTVADVVGTEFIAAVSPPTALSLTWGLQEYVAELAEAAQAVTGAAGG